MTTQSSKQKRGCFWWLGVVLKLSSTSKQIIAEKSEHSIATATVIAGVEAVAISGMLVADSVYPN